VVGHDIGDGDFADGHGPSGDCEPVEDQDPYVKTGDIGQFSNSSSPLPGTPAAPAGLRCHAPTGV
jgi:hypothetical protein